MGGLHDLSPRNENKIEKFCNRVAAEFLVPTREFETLWDAATLDWKANLPVLASRFHVSQWVVARRSLVDSGCQSFRCSDCYS